MVEVQDIESGIDKENRDVGDESVEGQNIEKKLYDYPKSPSVEAQYKSKGQTYNSYYNVIALGTYPIAPKLSQKTNCDNIPQYWISDYYIIETEVAERKVKCETKYESNSK
ncbi:4532_t:CDS:2, partial [Diversispora eburnea]